MVLWNCPDSIFSKLKHPTISKGLLGHRLQTCRILWDENILILNIGFLCSLMWRAEIWATKGVCMAHRRIGSAFFTKVSLTLSSYLTIYLNQIHKKSKQFIFFLCKILLIKEPIIQNDV
jgi:hypothetical protein